MIHSLERGGTSTDLAVTYVDGGTVSQRKPRTFKGGAWNHLLC